MEKANGCYTHFGLLSPKTFDCYFVDMMCVVFMTKFSSRLMEQANGCWTHFGLLAQKRLIPTF